MELSASAHVDTFCRDRLPPAEQWPEFRYDLPELRYPERLNCATRLLDEAVAQWGPDRRCLLTATEEWSYGELLRRAAQVAEVLTEELDVVPGSRVLLRGPNTPWLVACWFGVLRAGAVAVTTMPLLRAAELTKLHGIARPLVALCDHRFVEEPAAAETPGMRVVTYGGTDAADLTARCEARAGDFAAVDTAADDVALIAFTSGTTGVPKATMHFHRDVLAIADTFSRHILKPRPEDLFTGTPPLGFTFGLGGLVVFPMGVGAATLLVEKAGPEELADLVKSYGVTVLFTAPTVYRAMLAAGVADRLSGLRRAVSAGEPLPADVWRRFHEATGVRLIDGIGATEMLHVFVSAAADDIRPGATGRAVPGYQAAVLDESGDPVPDGQPGLLAVKGPTGCRYLADERQRGYVRNGWNITGDIYIKDADGYFWYQARSDDMIVSAGYNIAGPEVEQALLTHSEVEDCGVVAAPDEERGTVVKAYVVLRDGTSPGDETASRLQDFVKQAIAPYKYPRAIEFVSELPRSATGKLLRSELRRRARAAASLPKVVVERRVEWGQMGHGAETVRVAVIGGGPGGLYFAALAKQLSPAWQVTVWERNVADDTFGFGVVFSDETLDGIAQADPEVFAAMSSRFARWSDIDVRFGGRTLTSGGHGFAALGRRQMLGILQDRCMDLGVDVRYRTQAPPVEELSETYDLVVAADGVRSATRARYADTFGPDLDERRCRYMWLGTDRVFEAFTFIVEEKDFGVIQVHAYPFDENRSTFIVELSEESWRRAGFVDTPDLPVGASDEAGIRRCEELLADHLDGHRLIGNNSRWISFTTVRNRSWRHRNVVLLGDAAHTAHFSIGSGTKLAMEDAVSLAACLHEHAGIPEALAAYEAERRPVVESTQRAAQASLEWFENIDRYVRQQPAQFAVNLLTRSRRVTYDNLRQRDPQFMRSWFGESDAVPPMFRPFQLAGLRLRNRVVLPPIATYSAVDGVPNTFERAHLGTHALGGAGLVFTGMTAVSAAGRATRACTGLYTDEQEAAWRQIVETVHEQSEAYVGVQLTHAGRRAGAAAPGSEEAGGRPTVAASAIPWEPGGPVPRAATREDLRAIREDFAAAARRADRAGFDALELQYGHGQLISGFLSPLTNRRDDEYGGGLNGRLRFPLDVLAAVRAAWPADKPLIVRISATDWAEGGTSEAEAVEICRALAAAGADAVDVSTGEVVPYEQPRYGRSYQTPFADLIRNATGIPTIAVGAISSYEDVNSIILAGRADLCAVGRAQLNDPLWTLHAAADQGYAGPGASWPRPWLAGSRTPPGRRAERPEPRLHRLRSPAEPVHQRWLPRQSDLASVAGGS